MKTITILGVNGMLGSAVYKYFIALRDNNLRIKGTTRNPELSSMYNLDMFDITKHSIDSLFPTDYIINCIGIIKPYMKNNTKTAISINSLFPWELAEACKNNGTRLIHITTDCVFSGTSENKVHTESTLHDALDDYGKSKSLGEPTNCMVIRTSIIGEEPNHGVSLVEWAKSQKGKSVKGFKNHLWNGITTKEYARCCHTIIENKLYEDGIFHVFGNTVAKDRLLMHISDTLNLKLAVDSIDAEIGINRVLGTEKNLCNKLFPHGLRDIKDMLLDSVVK